MRTLYVHIGTHKTGSTSLQRWLIKNTALLEMRGYGLYPGMHIADNHVELYLAAMRYDRDSFGKQSMTGAVFDERYTALVTNRITRFIAANDKENLIFTTEGLSLLRHDDELKKLKDIFGPECNKVIIILCLRNKHDYLKSYTQQLLKKRGRKKSRDFWSALYVEEDTWLVDYESLIHAYRNTFGADSVKIIDYDKEMNTRGNIIPAFTDAVGLQLNADDTRVAGAFRYNATLPKAHGVILRNQSIE